MVLQLYGSSNRDLVKATEILFANIPDLLGVDINLGCPAPCAKKESYGYYFMDDEVQLLQQLKTMFPHKQISAKIRLKPTLQENVVRLE